MIKTAAILSQQYNSYVNPSAKIGRMVKRGELTPIIKGLYETNPSVPGHYLAGIIYGPSYLSFEYALSWYELIPEAVYSFTSATCRKNRTKRYETPFGLFTYRDVPVSTFPYGTVLHEENGYGFILASAEKAICDQIYTCAPCSNRKELLQLLFDDLRIDEKSFRGLNTNELIELATLYKTKNHRLLITLLAG